MKSAVRRFSDVSRRGAIVVLLAVLLPVLLMLSAFAVNLAWIELSRTQTFIAADAATRAAGRTYSLTGSVASARTKANEIAALNPVAGRSLSLENSDFVLGTSLRPTVTDRYAFTAGGVSPNALKVTIRQKVGGTNGAIALPFPRILGHTQYEVNRSAVSTRVEVDIAFVVDRSGSMAYASNEKAVYPPLPKAAGPSWFFGQPAPTPSRWRDLESAAVGFISELNSSVIAENVSLVTYGDSAGIDRSMTSNYPSIQAGLTYYTNAYPSGQTNIGAGLTEGLRSLSGGAARNSASKVILLMTDGIRTPGLGPNPVTVAKNAADQGVIVFAVTFSDEADQTGMKLVAEAGMGQHFHATDAAALTIVFQTIVRILPTILTE